jgi:hypothetical protein
MKIRNAPGGANSWTFTIMKNGLATALEVTISGVATESSTDADTVAISAGDEIYIQATPTGAPSSPGRHWFTFQFIPTIDNETLLLHICEGTVGYSVYENIIGAQADIATIANMTSVCPSNGTLKKFFVRLSVAPGSGKSRTFTVYKNNVATSLAVTVSGTATTNNNIVNTVAVSAGDRLTIFSERSGTALASYYSGGIVFVPSTNNQYITHGKETSLPYQTIYFGCVSAGVSSISSNEEDHYGIFQTGTVKAMYVWFSVAPGAGTSKTLTLRKNGVNTSLSVTISGTNTSGYTVLDVAVTSFDILTYTISAYTGAPTGQVACLGFLFESPSAAVGDSPKLCLLGVGG